MSENNVINLNKYKRDHELTTIRYNYIEKIKDYSNIELLEEMVRFQEARMQLGTTTPQMMIEGQILFHRIEVTCNTDELRTLATSYKRHLYHEYEEYLKRRRNLRLV